MKRPNRYYQQKEHVEQDLDAIIQELDGKFPSELEIRDRIYSLPDAIRKYHGGLNKVRAWYGLAPLHKPDHYWRKKKNILKELDIIIRELGRFPTYAEIRKRNNSLASNFTNHEGIRHFQKYYGLSFRKDREYWEDYDHVKKELDRLIKKEGKFPSTTTIQQENGALFHAIYRYHGGIVSLKKKYGSPLFEKPKGYWQSRKNIRQEFDAIRKELGYFPQMSELVRINASLSGAIKKQYGQFRNFALLYGQKPSRNESGYWKDIEQVRESLEILIKDLGHFPKINEIQKLGRGLYGGIIRHGGLQKVKLLLGYSQMELGIIKDLVQAGKI